MRDPDESGTRFAISARCTAAGAGIRARARLDGDARIVTFANGTVARELLVDCDDARRRLVYAMISERVKHYNASVQVFADGDARSRLVWIVDVLPNEIAPYIDGQMELAALAMQKALGRRRRSRADVIFLTEADARLALASPRASVGTAFRGACAREERNHDWS